MHDVQQQDAQLWSLDVVWKVDLKLSTKTKCSMTFITHNIPYNITLNRK